MLSQDDYYRIIKQTQIVSVDLLIKNTDQKYLLGKRVNSPAKGFLFCPGGRVFKDESIQDAAKRVLKDEVGLEWGFITQDFIGAYEHVYSDNFRDDKFGTHYISMAWLITLPNFKKISVKNMQNQHSGIAWMTSDDILKSDDVHKFVKYFFDIKAPNKIV